MIIKEYPPKVIHSPEHDEIYRLIEERAKNKEDYPMKYSYNMDSLQTIR